MSGDHDLRNHDLNNFQLSTITDCIIIDRYS